MSSRSSNTESSAESSSDDTHQSIPVDAAGPLRSRVVRLMLPGRQDPDNQLTTFRPLERLIDNVLNEDTLDHLEILGMPGENQYEHYLCGHDLSTTNPTVQREAIKRTDRLQKTFEVPDEDAGSQASNKTTPANAIMDQLDEHHPAVDYQVGWLDLSPLAETPVPTSRLLVYDNHTIASAETGTLNAIALLKTLLERRIPHVYQLLITTGSKNSSAAYLATARLAVFDEEYGIVTEEDFAEHLHTSYQYCLSKHFREQNATSNFELPIQRFKQTLSDSAANRYQINGRPKYLRDEPFPIEELATFREYDNLLAGSFNADPRYEKHFNCHARFPLHGNAVAHFAGILPQYFEYSPWQRTAVTEQPTFITQRIPPSTSTPQRLGTKAVPSDHPKETNKSESKAHRALINYIVDYIIQQGYTVLAVDQDTIDADLSDPDPRQRSYFPGKSQPDIVAEKDGEITVFEAEINDSNPAAFLKNLERAAHFDYPVVVVTEKTDLCGTKLGHASQPFKQAIEQGVKLFTLSESIEDGDVTYLLPQDASEAVWYLSCDQLTLSLSGYEISGHAETPLHDWSYDLPYYETRGSEYAVFSASGSHLDTFGKKTELHKEYTELKAPFIPTAITYLSQTEFRYKGEGNQLKRYYKNPRWAQQYQNKSGKRTKAARDDFIESHTAETDGDVLFIPDVRQRFTDWFDHQTDLDWAGESWFSRGIDEKFNASDVENRDRELKDRSWYYTPGLSPQTPSFPDPEGGDAKTED